jgi:hypothetical protein
MIRLRKLRSRLRSLGRRRRAARLAIGYSALIVAAVWLLVGIFLADWLLDMNPAQRLVVAGVAMAGLVWAFVRLTRPWLGPRETLIDMALLVQGQRHIDSDLVAALQFERPEAAEWGSVDMERAVIEQVGRASRRLEIVLGVSTRQLMVRLAILAVTLGVVAAAAWLYREDAAVFFRRLAMGSDRYRTETTIRDVTINGQPVDLSAQGAEEIRCAYGQPVRLEVTCSGRLPPDGRAVLKSEGSPEKKVTLQPRRQADVYVGQSERLLDTASCRVFVGDDRTRPIRLVVAPPPVVDVFLDVTPPSYAAGPAPTETVSGLRQLAVIEGSRVRVRITADKELREATITIKPLQEEAAETPGATEGKSHAMKRLEDRPSGDAKVLDAWALEPVGTPLEKLVEPVRYFLQVTDVEGLQLEQPIEGVIRVYTDQPPQIFASAKIQLVIPKARPTIDFQAADDYGLAQIKVLSEVIHADGSPGEKGEVTVYTLSPGEPPSKNIQQSHPLVLAPLKAVKGDKIKVVVQAVDHRGGPGRPEGKAAESDPIEFQVTDMDGILAAILEADRESARQYKTMIDDQIDVGGGK